MNSVRLNLTVLHKGTEEQLVLSLYFDNTVMMPDKRITFMGFPLNVTGTYYDCGVRGIELNVTGEISLNTDKFKDFHAFMQDQADRYRDFDTGETFIKKKKEEVIH